MDLIDLVVRRLQDGLALPYDLPLLEPLLPVDLLLLVLALLLLNGVFLLDE